MGQSSELLQWEGSVLGTSMCAKQEQRPGTHIKEQASFLSPLLKDTQQIHVCVCVCSTEQFPTPFLNQ